MKTKALLLLLCPAFLLMSCKSKNDPQDGEQDQQGQGYLLDSTISYSSDVLQHKDIFFYHSDGRQDYKLRYDYNSESHTWIASNKTEYANWNSEGEYGQYIESVPAESEWSPTVRFTRNFDSSGKVSSELYETREGGNWLKNLEYKYTHTSQGDVETRESWYYYNDVVYYSAVKYQYFYRADHIDSLYTYARSEETASYVLDSKTVCPKYDEKGNRTEEIIYAYSNDNWILTNSVQKYYQYLEVTDLIAEYTELNTHYDEDGNKSSAASLTKKHFYSKH